MSTPRAQRADLPYRPPALRICHGKRAQRADPPYTPPRCAFVTKNAQRRTIFFCNFRECSRHASAKANPGATSAAPPSSAARGGSSPRTRRRNGCQGLYSNLAGRQSDAEVSNVSRTDPVSVSNRWDRPTDLHTYFPRGNVKDLSLLRLRVWRSDWDGEAHTSILFDFTHVLLLVGTPLILIVFRLYRRRASFRAGHRPACGYDLRATPERCPECGRVTDCVASTGGTAR